jgi:hypothetical protein
MEAFRQDGFRFIIYPNDHSPPHVHVFKGGAEVLIFLGDSNALPSFRENRGMRRKDALKAIHICRDRQEELLRSWEQIHG